MGKWQNTELNTSAYFVSDSELSKPWRIYLARASSTWMVSKETLNPQTCWCTLPPNFTGCDGIHRYAMPKPNLTACNRAFLLFWTCGSEKPPKATIMTQCPGNSRAKYFGIGLEHAKCEHSTAAHTGARLSSLWYSRQQ